MMSLKKMTYSGFDFIVCTSLLSLSLLLLLLLLLFLLYCY